MSLFGSALAHFRAGQLEQAERLCRDVLAVEPNNFDCLHLLGIIATRTGRLDAAVDSLNRALAVNAHSAECHFNLAQVHRMLGGFALAADHLTKATDLKRDDLASHICLGDVLMQLGRSNAARKYYQRALALEPRSLEAHYGLANTLMQDGQLDEASRLYRHVLVLKPDWAEALNNFGIVLMAQGDIAEATEQYRRARALKPGLVDVHRNLARAVLAQGNVAEALDISQNALAIAETDELKALFVQCARSLPALPNDDEFRALVARALSEGWGRPAELSAVAATLFSAGPAVRDRIAAVAHAWPARPAAADMRDDLRVLADDRLLRALLESAPIHDVALERFLTCARAALPSLALAAGRPADHDHLLDFCAALAKQCFINEYVFAATDDERRQATELGAMLDNALATGAPLSPFLPVAVAAYGPLHALVQAQTLQTRRWPAAIDALLAQQVREPLQELQFAASAPALTPIEDEVSRKVQRQYEQMPYPRWVTSAPVGRPVAVGWYLRHQFPLAPAIDLGATGTLDVLVAGCGTGQHAIETARRFAGARVLAIDLSRASLGYAIRKTQALGLGNIEYAQADILALGTLGRSFDVIESIGVLHHLGDPEQGWRVLLSLLRPGGLMHVGLYSSYARASIRAARALIAARGYGDTADDIRRARQDILGLPDDDEAKAVARFSDFFTVSECRDLLFHVQEHQFTIPRIKQFIDEHGLAFLGFGGPAARNYADRFPHDKAMTDLDQWHAFETHNPMAFVNMYQFWVQRPAAALGVKAAAPR